MGATTWKSLLILISKNKFELWPDFFTHDNSARLVMLLKALKSGTKTTTISIQRR
jgi:hypothetical protein